MDPSLARPARIRQRDRAPDPWDRLGPRDWADLPTTHPAEAGPERRR